MIRSWNGPSRAACFAGLALLLMSTAAGAQVRLPGSGEAGTEEAGPTVELLTQQREEVASQLDALRASLQDGDTNGFELEQLTLLEGLDRMLAGHQESLAQLEGTPAGASASSPLAGNPPYPFALYEATSQALDIHRRQLGLLSEQLKSRRAELERLADEAEAAERQRRRAREQAENASDPVERSEASRRLRRVELESRIAQAELARTRTRVELEAIALELQRGQAELLEATLGEVRDRMAMSRRDLDEPLARVAAREETARSDAEDARVQLATAERRLVDAQRRSDRLPTPPPELRAEVEARRAQRQLAQTRIAAAEARLEQRALERSVWNRRFDALQGAPRDELSLWSEEIARETDRLRRAERLQRTHRDAAVQEAERLRRSIDDAAPTAAPWLRQQVAATEALAATHAEILDEAAEARALLKRVARDFEPERRALDPFVGLRNLGPALLELWERELFVVDDRSITVGKLVLATLLFAVAIFASRRIAGGLGRWVFRRAFEPGAALAFESLTFYALLVAFFLLALRTVNIPLTAFALLGGALAIGIGFGSQNVIGNFIGGLILLVERPIRVGDVVEVDAVTGVVDRIGPRSTQLRTFDNLHVIVPNSLLLEQRVVNWTLSDQTVRRQIDVGVAYDAPVREVTKLVLRALDEHGRILRKPEPRVLFHDFGNDALVFRIYFWMKMDPRVSFLEVESDIRHRTFHLFQEANITIAYPQRDVHLDATRPLDVRITPPSEADG